VTLDMTTYTIMRALPREVDPTVYEMLHEDPGDVSFSSVGGLNEQIRELREVIELPLTNPELFKRVGIKPPKVRWWGSGGTRVAVQFAVDGASNGLLAIAGKADALKARPCERTTVHPAAGRAAVWPTRHRQDAAGASAGMQPQRDLPQGGSSWGTG
jgi:hypothetical protein